MNTGQIKQLWEESVTHMNTALYSNSLHFLLWGQLYIRQNGLWSVLIQARLVVV